MMHHFKRGITLDILKYEADKRQFSLCLVKSKNVVIQPAAFVESQGICHEILTR